MFTKSNSVCDFRITRSMEQRRSDNDRMQKFYPNSIQVVLQSKSIFLDRSKYLVPNNLTIGQFLFYLRQKISVNTNKGLYLFVEQIDKDEKTMSTYLPQTGNTLEMVYTNWRHIDGYLYMFIEQEST